MTVLRKVYADEIHVPVNNHFMSTAIIAVFTSNTLPANIVEFTSDDNPAELIMSMIQGPKSQFVVEWPIYREA